MAKIFPGRRMAEMDGDFVVFMIGMRINRWWKFHKWVPVFTAMPRMLKELAAHPELGCLHAELWLGVIVQYWHSFEDLEAYARATSHEHLPAWQAFNAKVHSSSGDVGIWHETFRIHAGEYETIYASTPRMGLAKAGRHVAVTEHRDTARERLAAQTSS